MSLLTQTLESVKQAARQVDVSQLRNSLLAVCVAELRTALAQERGVTDRAAEFARVLALLEAADGDNSTTRVSLQVVRELALAVAQLHDPNGTISRVYSHFDSRYRTQHLNVPTQVAHAGAPQSPDVEIPDLSSVFRDIPVRTREPERALSSIFALA